MENKKVVEHATNSTATQSRVDVFAAAILGNLLQNRGHLSTEQLDELVKYAFKVARIACEYKPKI